MQSAGSDEQGPEQAHPEHHGILGALKVAGEVYADALTSFVGPHHPDHWELVLEQYKHDHPKPAPAE